MLSSQERAVLIDQIRRLPEQIDYLAGALSPQEMTGRFRPGEWTAAQNIHHLADSHMNSYIRCRLMLTEEEPPLKPYDQERWAAIPDAEAADVTPSLHLLRGLHTRWVQFYEALAEEDWQRTGSHPERGIVTIENQLQMYARHGQGHVNQIRWTVAGQYPSVPETQDELLARIDREWERLHSLLRRLSPEQMTTPLDGGWSPQQHLAHITAWERFALFVPMRGEPAHVALGIAPDQLEPWDIDAINAAVVETNAGQSLDETMTTFQAVHAELRAAVAALNWAEWHGQMHIVEGYPPEPRLAWITGNSYEHYLEHWAWLPV